MPPPPTLNIGRVHTIAPEGAGSALWWARSNGEDSRSASALGVALLPLSLLSEQGLNQATTGVRETLTTKQHIPDGQWLPAVAPSQSWDSTKKDLHVTDTALRLNWLKTKSFRRFTGISAGIRQLSKRLHQRPGPNACIRQASHFCPGLTRIRSRPIATEPCSHRRLPALCR